MTSAYPYAFVAVCSDIEAGNRLAAAIDPDDGSKTFGPYFPTNKGCRAIGSSGAATHWPARGLLSAGRYAVVRQFIDDPTSYPAALLAMGMTHQQIDDARASLQVEAGPREQYERALPAFLESVGLEVLPQ